MAAPAGPRIRAGPVLLLLLIVFCFSSDPDVPLTLALFKEHQHDILILYLSNIADLIFVQVNVGE